MMNERFANYMVTGSIHTPRNLRIDSQTRLAIHEVQNRETKKDLAKAATAVGIVAGATLLPNVNAQAASPVVENQNLFDTVTRTVSENWKLVIPAAAAVDGIVDGIIDMSQSKEDKGFGEYAKTVAQSAAVEGAEMVVVLLAAQQVVEHPEAHPILNTIGRWVLPFAAVYAVLPDALGERAGKFIDAAIDTFANGLKSINSRQRK